MTTEEAEREEATTEHTSTQSRNESKNDKNSPCSLSFTWLQTKLGLLKLFQLIVLMATVVIISTSEYNIEQKFSSIDVFWAVHAITIAAVITTIIAYTADISNKLPRMLRKPVVKIVLCSLAYISLIASSAWVISNFHRHGRVVMAALFGLFSGFLFVIEDMFYVVSYTRHATWLEGELVYQHMVEETE